MTWNESITGKLGKQVPLAGENNFHTKPLLAEEMNKVSAKARILKDVSVYVLYVTEPITWVQLGVSCVHLLR